MNLDAAIAELAPKIGTELHVSPWVTITQERIDDFADATGDHQWIHVDPARARAESPFGATIAHGYLVLSLYPSMRGHDGRNTPPLPGVTRTINYGVNRVRFPSPVRAGHRRDRVRREARLCGRDRAADVL